MIKNSAHIRTFTDKQKQQLEAISAKEKIKNANDVLLFTLDKYQDLVYENAQLLRLLESKKREIKTLKGEIDD